MLVLLEDSFHPSFFAKPKKLTIFESLITQLVCPPNFAQFIVFACSREYAVLPGAFENNILCKIWGANRVYYGGFENRE